MGDEKHREAGVSPAEFTKGMPEGEGAGPDSPETLEPHGGEDTTEGSPGGPASKGIGGTGPEGGKVSRGDGEKA